MHFTILFWNASILKPLLTIIENIPWNHRYVKEKLLKNNSKKRAIILFH